MDIDVTVDQTKELEMIQRSGSYTVPQIFIDGQHIGGHDNLFALEAKGNLDPILRRFANRQETLAENEESDIRGFTH